MSGDLYTRALLFGSGDLFQGSLFLGLSVEVVEDDTDTLINDDNGILLVDDLGKVLVL